MVSYVVFTNVMKRTKLIALVAIVAIIAIALRRRKGPAEEHDQE